MRNRICQADLRFLALIATIAIPNPSHRCPGLEQASFILAYHTKRRSLRRQTAFQHCLGFVCMHDVMGWDPDDARDRIELAHVVHG
jgi:hypothetical protein